MLRKKAYEAKTLALSTQVRAPSNPRARRRAVEQPLGRFADEHEIKLCSARVGKALRRMGISADGPYPGIKLVDVAKPQMWRNFGAVLVAHLRQAYGPQKHGVRRAGAGFAIGLNVTSCFSEVGCARINIIMTYCRQAALRQCRCGDSEGGIGNITTNSITANNSNKGDPVIPSFPTVWLAHRKMRQLYLSATSLPGEAEMKH